LLRTISVTLNSDDGDTDADDSSDDDDNGDDDNGYYGDDLNIKHLFYNETSYTTYTLHYTLHRCLRLSFVWEETGVPGRNPPV